MKKFSMIETPTDMSNVEEIATGSLSYFDGTRIPVAGDYIRWGESIVKVDGVLFDIDTGDLLLSVTTGESVIATIITKEKHESRERDTNRSVQGTPEETEEERKSTDDS